MTVISYFSYKGGAGRSTLAFNTIPFLAAEHLHPTKDTPIVILDMDIDSCGMSYLLEIEDKDIDDEGCVQNLLENGCDNVVCTSIAEHPTLSKLIPVGNRFGYAENEAVLFMPAKNGRDVSDGGSYNDAQNPFERRLSRFVDVCALHNVSAVILDSAVGTNTTARAGNCVADILVCTMRPTTQFVNGTVRYLETLDMDDGPSFCGTVVVVPNVVPVEPLVVDGQMYPQRAYKRIKDKFRELLDKHKTDDDIIYEDGMMMNEKEFGIPAVKSFMWREGQLYTQDVLSDEEAVVLERYKKLAGLIANHCE